MKPDRVLSWFKCVSRFVPKSQSDSRLNRAITSLHFRTHNAGRAGMHWTSRGVSPDLTIRRAVADQAGARPYRTTGHADVIS